MLSIFYHQNNVPFHCVDLVPCFCQQWFQKKEYSSYFSQRLVKHLRAAFQLHFKVTSSAGAAGVMPLHLTALLEPGTQYPGKEKYQHISKTAWCAETGTWTFYAA